MKQYDAECPVCGRINRGLYLEETGGWMECEACGNEVKVRRIRISQPGAEKPKLKKTFLHAARC